MYWNNIILDILKKYKWIINFHTMIESTRSMARNLKISILKLHRSISSLVSFSKKVAYSRKYLEIN